MHLFKKSVFARVCNGGCANKARARVDAFLTPLWAIPTSQFFAFFRQPLGIPVDLAW